MDEKTVLDKCDIGEYDGKVKVHKVKFFRVG